MSVDGLGDLEFAILNEEAREIRDRLTHNLEIHRAASADGVYRNRPEVEVHRLAIIRHAEMELDQVLTEVVTALMEDDG